MISEGLWVVCVTIIVGVLMLSGALKVRKKDLVDQAFKQLHIPHMFSPAWMRRFLPWGEIFLSVALLFLSGPMFQVAAAINVGLFLAYLVIVIFACVRSHRTGTVTSCHCFGELSDAPISVWTVVRNAVFLSMAVCVLLGQQHSPWQYQITMTPEPLIYLAPVVLLCAVLWSEHRYAKPTATRDNDPTDQYHRKPIPHYALTYYAYETDRPVILAQLCLTNPVLLIRIDPECGSCQTVIEQWEKMKEAMSPTVKIMLVISRRQGFEQLHNRVPAEDCLIDTNAMIDKAFNTHGAPWAVLLGADGLMAGGPENGPEAIGQMVTEIEDFLHKGAA